MVITTTLNRIRAHSPCGNGWRKLLAGLGKTDADDEPLPYARIVEINGIDDALWACRAEPQHVKEWRLFGVWCARQVESLMEDGRSYMVLNVAERHANGQVTDEELNAARSAAWDAARSVAWDAARSVAWDAARSVAWDAAWDAARSAACDAARSAARSAAWDAAWDAARSAARSAAWDAARSVAWDAARSVAWDAARSVAWDAAWDAARSAACDAARSAQTTKFLEIVGGPGV